MLDKFVEKRIARKAEEEQKRNMEYANFVKQLIGEVADFKTRQGTFKLQKRDYPILGIKEVPCSYNVNEYAVDLELDYSSKMKLFPRMFEIIGFDTFDRAGVDEFAVRRVLNKYGIEIFRDRDHPEYDIDSTYYCKDKLLISTTLDNAKTIARARRLR